MKILQINIIALFLFTFDVGASNIDSLNSFVSFHFSKSALRCYDQFYEKPGPFEKNFIINNSILFNKKVVSIKKTSILGCVGLNFKTLHVGYTTSTMATSSINEDFSENFFMLGLQFGLSVERRIFKLKNQSGYLNIGFTGSGTFFNTSGTSSYEYDMPNNTFGKDSIVLDFQSNRIFYLNPYFQLTMRARIKENCLVYGFRYLLATELDQTNLHYAFYDTRNPGFYRYKGVFLDSQNKLEIFVGFAF